MCPDVRNILHMHAGCSTRCHLPPLSLSTPTSHTHASTFTPPLPPSHLHSHPHTSTPTLTPPLPPSHLHSHPHTSTPTLTPPLPPSHLTPTLTSTPTLTFTLTSHTHTHHPPQLQKQGGIITQEDLLHYRAVWEQPVCVLIGGALRHTCVGLGHVTRLSHMTLPPCGPKPYDTTLLWV